MKRLSTLLTLAALLFFLVPLIACRLLPTIVVTATPTPIPPTVVPGVTPTPVPPTIAPAETATPVPPTVAPAATATPIPIPPTETPTPIPPTETPIPIPPTETPTPVPPTATPTETPPPFAVTGTTASVSPTSYSGTCPGTFNFSANITTNGAGTVTYRWERSDGAVGPTQSLTFAGPGTQTVTTSWSLGARGTFWERIHILSPNDAYSNQATFTNNCTTAFAVTNVTASVSPTSYSGTCPGTFNFSANITTNGAGTVTYRWERSDGAVGPTESLTFTGPGTRTVSTSWTLGARGTFWERVHILTPNNIYSNQATFTNNCR